MRVTEHTFKPEFINTLLAILDEKGIRSIYNLNTNAKYSIDYLTDVIIAISQKSYTRYRIPENLANYFKESLYCKFSRTSIKNLVKQQLGSCTNDSFFSTYVVIGYDLPITIRELEVVC